MVLPLIIGQVPFNLSMLAIYRDTPGGFATNRTSPSLSMYQATYNVDFSTAWARQGYVVSLPVLSRPTWINRSSWHRLALRFSHNAPGFSGAVRHPLQAPCYAALIDHRRCEADPKRGHISSHQKREVHCLRNQKPSLAPSSPKGQNLAYATYNSCSTFLLLLHSHPPCTCLASTGPLSSCENQAGNESCKA